MRDITLATAYSRACADLLYGADLVSGDAHAPKGSQTNGVPYHAAGEPQTDSSADR